MITVTLQCSMCAWRLKGVTEWSIRDGEEDTRTEVSNFDEAFRSAARHAYRERHSILVVGTVEPEALPGDQRKPIDPAEPGMRRIADQ